jgi:hypothetical protein
LAIDASCHRRISEMAEAMRSHNVVVTHEL